MARTELQIATPLLFEGLQPILGDALYQQCILSPVPNLYLDRILISAGGPITQTAHMAPSAIDVGVFVTIYVVTGADVAAAKGGPPSSSLLPEGAMLTVDFEVALSGTVLSMNYNGIAHDDNYTGLLEFMADVLNSEAIAKALLSQIETQAAQLFAGQSLPSIDISKSLPQFLQNQQIGRTAICGDEKVIAVRLEFGKSGSDGSWSDFRQGELNHLINDGQWGLYLSGDLLSNIINAKVAYAVQFGLQQVTGIHLPFPFSVQTQFTMLSSDPNSSWIPDQTTIAAETPAAYSNVNIYYTLKIDGGLETDTGEIIISFNFAFTTHEYADAKGGHDYHLDLFMQYQITNAVEYGLIGSILSAFANFNLNIPTSDLNGFTPVGDGYVSSNPLAPIKFDKLMTLNPSGSKGVVLPPITAQLQSVIDALQTNIFDGAQEVPGMMYGMPGTQAGLLIYGDAKTAPAGKAVPDCAVKTTDFALVYSLIGATQSKRPTPINVPAIASFSLFNKGPNAGNRYPLKIGGFYPYADADGQWAQTPSVLPSTPANAGTFTITIPESDFVKAYLAAPYPMQLIACTNGGARLIDLGAIPVPIIDPSNGYVTNPTEVLTSPPPPPSQGGGSSGTQRPVTGTKPPASG